MVVKDIKIYQKIKSKNWLSIDFYRIKLQSSDVICL